MNMQQLEKRLEEHAKTVKSTLHAPFCTEMEVLTMKKRKINTRKIISFAATAAVFACLATAFALGGLGGWYSAPSGTINNIYDSAPMSEKLGFAPVIIDRFENGYSFVKGNYVDNQIYEDDGSAKEEFKSVMFEYEKDGDTVFLSQDKSDSIMVDKGELLAIAEGAELYFYAYTNKVVPEDYIMSEEDKIAEANGELVFSWGSDKVDTFVVQSIQWRMGDFAFTLMQMDGALTPNELADMALEIIRAGKTH